MTSGDVTTSDTLLATQLLLGNGGKDIVTEPDLIYNANVFSIAGGLFIGGPQTIINSTDIKLRDHNIEIGNVESPTDLTADGGGITLLGDTNKTISWTDFSGFWKIEPGLNVPVELHIGDVTGAHGVWDTGGINLAPNNGISIDDVTVFDVFSGQIVLRNIEVLDSLTETTIENAMDILPNLTFIGGTSGAVTGPSGEWNSGGFDLGPNDAYAFNGVDVLSDASGTITLSNINVLDATTEDTILAISGIGNVTTPDTLIANRLLTGNEGSEILTEPSLFWDGIVMGVGTITPLSKLHIYEDTSFGGGSEGLTIEQDGTGDAKINLLLTGSTRFALGIDNNDGNKFKISDSSNFGVSDIAFTIVPGSMLVGIGQPSPLTRLHVSTDLGDTTPVTTFESTAGNSASTRNFVGTRAPEGIITGNPGDHYHRVSGIGSNDFIQKAAASGNTGWRESVTTPDALLRSGNVSGFALNQLKLSLDAGLLFTHTIKTRHDIDDQFNNAIDFFLWDADTDGTGDVGTLPVLTLRGDGKVGIGKTSPSAIVDILSLFGDTTPVISMESSSNEGIVDFRVGDRDPNAAVSGIGPDVYFADRGALSGSYESLSASSDQVWFKRSVLPANIIELHNSTELDDLASGGVITIASPTTWHVRGPLTTANRIVVNPGVSFTISGEFNVTGSITYTGTDIFISSNGLLRIRSGITLISSSTGTLFNNTGGILNLEQSQYAGWDDLGICDGLGGLFFANTVFANIGSGLAIIDDVVVNMINVTQVGSPLNGALFTINTNNPLSVMSFTNISANSLGASGSIFDLNTRINNNASIKVNRTSVVTGNILKLLLANATINSVADGSIATGTITAMADNGSGGTTISSTTTYFEDEEVTITGTTSYSGTFQVFNVVAGVSFDTITGFVADDATGSVDTVRLTLTLAGGHGIVTGDSIKIIDTNFYNGFETTLNVATNDITVNGVFISTNTGSIEIDVSLDKTDPRVSAFNNFGISDSVSVATGHVNDNSTATGTIVNNTFTDMVFGTVGAALLANSTMERWRLVNELNGTFEYFGQEPFDGRVGFDFTVESGGGTVDFRFKWVIDKGAGFVDLTDNVESLVAVGSDSQSVTKAYPLFAEKGDQIKPQITRNSGSSSITSTYVTIYVST